MPPTLIALPPGVERPMLVRRRDGRLDGFFLKDTETPTPRVARITSHDDGRAWDEAPDVLTLPDTGGLWGGLEVLADADDEVHCFFMHDRGSGVFGAPLAGEGVAHEGPYHGKFLDIWHLKSRDGGEAWTEPKRIWEGFTGALNSVIQLRNGRIVLPFASATGQTWAHRVDTGLDAFSFSGAFYSTVVYSDDAGDTWRQGTRDIKSWAPIPAYGADEPVIIQKLDGRVWMLLRTQTGRLYESFSDDGAEWSVARPTPLISSDSPVGLVRLSDSRLVLIWNGCQRFPYAYGGRHVLHAAISEDDGLTWRGYREVLRDPRRHDPPPTVGDFGTAYPFPLVTNDDSVIIVSGQGEGRILMARLDPAVALRDPADQRLCRRVRGLVDLRHRRRRAAAAPGPLRRPRAAAHQAAAGTHVGGRVELSRRPQWTPADSPSDAGRRRPVSAEPDGPFLDAVRSPGPIPQHLQRPGRGGGQDCG